MKRLPLLVCMIVCPILLLGQNFHYPIPPDNITDRQERINYMTGQFWDNQSIADTINFQSPKLLLDYLYLLKHSSNEEQHIKSFIALSCKQQETFGLILYWLDNILYDSSSPHYDEELYLQLMIAVIDSEAESVMKLIPQQRIDILSKNKIGEPASNFSFINKMGVTGELYGIEAPLLMLIFNNPDCSSCQNAADSISNNIELQRLINQGYLKILAITANADYDDWLKHSYPTNWLVGYDKEQAIYDQNLYNVQRVPCIYLLDKEKRVLLKEADYKRLRNYLVLNHFPHQG